MKTYVREVTLRPVPRGWVCIVWLSDNPHNAGNKAGGAFTDVWDGPHTQEGMMKAYRHTLRGARARWRGRQHPFEGAPR